MKRILLLLICAVTFAVNVFAQFSGSGSGTKDDPYRIFNADQLNQVRNVPSAYFSLEADIDMTAWIEENNPNQGWKPIPFSGHFDGKNHKIINLFINRQNFIGVGLFSTIHSADIYNLSIENSKYIGANNVGGIVGIIEGKSSISNCTYEGKLVGKDNVGGIFGKVDGRVTLNSCISYVVIEGNNCLGGIAGFCDNDLVLLKKCFSENKITGNNNIGGIIGQGSSRLVTVNYSYSHSYLKGYDNIGGLVGNVATSISDSYCTGLIYGKDYVGGIFGNITDRYGSIWRCYSNCDKITGNSNIGGIFGANSGSSIKGNVALNKEIRAMSNLYRVGNYTNGENNNNYALVKAKMILTDELLPTPDDSENNGTNIGLSALKMRATYQGFGWDFNSYWNIQDTESFPYLITQTAPPYLTQKLKKGDTHLTGTCSEDGAVIVRVNEKTYITTSNNLSWNIDIEPLEIGDDVRISVKANDKMPSYILSPEVNFVGDGTEASPYLVSSANELRYVTDDAYYKLTTDIDLTDWIESNNDGKGWIPIGSIGPSMAKFDGGGHTVRGLKCDGSYENLGLFARLGKTGEIKNLNVEIASGFSLSGTNAVGGIVGINKGTISNVSVKGNIGDGLYVGGISGNNTGKILSSYTEGVVNTTKAKAYVGGIAGNSTGEVRDCYSLMSITATGSNTYAAGLVGYNSASVENCYATGDIKGYVAAGVVGYNSGNMSTIKGCASLNNIIKAAKSGLRVLGGYSSDAVTPGMDNYALKTTMVSVNDVPQKIYDDPLNGTSKTEGELMTRAQYDTFGWNFTNIWKIDEGTSYPYQESFNVPVTGLTIDKTSSSLEQNMSLTLTAKISPDNARNKTVKWSSSNDEVAKVEQNGTVTALSVGEATISAEACDGSGIKSTCYIKVMAKTQEIDWNQTFDNIFVGDTIELKATSSSGLPVEYKITKGAELASIKDGKLICKASGEVMIEAHQNGNGEYAEAEVISKSININKKSQAIGWDQTFDNIHVGDEVELNATSTSGLPVEYKIIEGNGLAEISVGKLICKAVGEVTVQAYQLGNVEYDEAESVSKTISIHEAPIVKLPQTIEWNQTLDDLHVGDEVKLEASASSGLPVDYVITEGMDLVEIADGKLICKGIGNATIEARQSGNDNYEAAESLSKAVVIVKRPQTIEWNQTLDNFHVGDEVELEGSASSGLPVDYVITEGMDKAEISYGKLICKAAGNITIEARQKGDDFFDAAENVIKTVIIKKQTQTIEWSQTLDNLHVGDEVKLEASASSGLPVDYVITDGVDKAEINDGKLICKAVGNITIEARQIGNDNYETAESVIKSAVIKDARMKFPVTIDGITYDYSDGNKVNLQVTQISGEQIRIKSEVDDIPVTGININDQDENSNVKEIYIPASINSIHYGSFEMKGELQKFVVDEDNQNYCDVDGVLFSKDKKILVAHPRSKEGSSYIIPDGTEIIAGHSFARHYWNLLSVDIPEGIKSIGDFAFLFCEAIKTITLPSTVENIGEMSLLLDGLNEMHSLIINPSSVSVSSNAFDRIDKEKCILYVPKGTKADYESTAYWKDFKNIVEEDLSGVNGNSVNDIMVTARNHKVYVKNLPANSIVKVFNTKGKLVYSGTKAEISLPFVDTYIISIGNRVWKIFVK